MKAELFAGQGWTNPANVDRNISLTSLRRCQTTQIKAGSEEKPRLVRRSWTRIQRDQKKHSRSTNRDDSTKAGSDGWGGLFWLPPTAESPTSPSDEPGEDMTHSLLHLALGKQRVVKESKNCFVSLLSTASSWGKDRTLSFQGLVH